MDICSLRKNQKNFRIIFDPTCKTPEEIKEELGKMGLKVNVENISYFCDSCGKYFERDDISVIIKNKNLFILFSPKD